MGTVQTRLTDREEEQIRYEARMAGAKSLSTFLRQRIIAGAAGPSAEALGELRNQLNAVIEQVAALNNSVRTLVEMDRDDMQLKLVAGIYLLLHPSVDRGAQAVVDQYLDLSGIENFLKANKRKGKKS